MDIEKIYTDLTKTLKFSTIFKNEPMAKHTSFKIGGSADILIKAKSIEDIKTILEYSKNENIPLYVMGNGSNLLVKDNGIRGIVIVVEFNEVNIEESEDKVKVTVGAGVKLGKLAGDLLKKGIGGFEFASGIPGTIGGAVRMNAGAHGKEMKDIVIKTTYMDFGGNINRVTNEQQEFSYRKSIFASKKWIILSTELELQYSEEKEIKLKMEEYAKYRREKQPITYPNAGSTFKRGEDFITAKLIDEAGLKGYTIGGAKVSSLHAGFIINTGNATADDVLKLVDYVTKTVYNKFGKKIELEIELIGE